MEQKGMLQRSGLLVLGCIPKYAASGWGCRGAWYSKRRAVGHTLLLPTSALWRLSTTNQSTNQFTDQLPRRSRPSGRPAEVQAKATKGRK